MSRWLFLISCLLVLAALRWVEPQRGPGAEQLGGRCERDADCQVGLGCAELEGVLERQCSATCSADEACHAEFGSGSMCIGADRCVRACERDAQCPAGTACNTFGWCEASLAGR